MIKAAYFCLFGMILILSFPSKAQETTQLPENFDPLEERFKIEGAYIPNYRELMRDVIVALGQYARENNPKFQIIADGGQALLARGEWENDLDDLHQAEMAGAQSDDERFLLKLFSPEHPIAVGSPIRRYISAINGLLLTNQICSGARGKLSSDVEKIIKEYGLSLIGIEHCSSEKEKKEAVLNLARKKIPVHADLDKAAAFDSIPARSELFLENPANIDSVSKVRNMLILTNTRNFTDKDLLVKTLGETNYDLLIVDPFFKSSIPFAKDDVKELQTKKVGAKRLVFAVLNISKAQDTRPYWEKGWKQGDPAWLRFQSKTDPSGLIVDFWTPVWKRILGVYFKSIMELGFDGIVLQGIDEHKTYEQIIPIN
ncbi:MAG: hypothetical protein IJ846_04105 [Alphaproteobacteria bacterium]|nr:hypothetical protein [Alphaproteobacteria bacterium]